ncbi:MAG TPA: crosslink repair DNA glycosylase YcaQ family protein [Opitutaceae bacterium]|nr:crosslink repair DNA glycosylase YcaQ family protein [Opitutaceae bacterium]
MIHAVRLAAPHASLAAAMDYHGYVQIDPLNICGRMHDLILRSRVAGYREGDLMRHLYEGPRVAIECHHPVQGVLAAFNATDWPFLMVKMRERAKRPRNYYHGRMTALEERLAETLLGEIASRGPTGPKDFEPGPRRRSDWGSGSTLVRKVFEKLFVHGRLVICRRDSFRRVYDLPERVLPPEFLCAPVPTQEEHDQWAMLSVLRQRRLVTLRKRDAALVRAHIAEVKVDGCPAMFCLRSDLPLLEQAAAGGLAEANGDPRLLAPLDPLIYDRRITSGLWNFDYTWEVYTPEAKRVRGYYALPILAGEAIVGHVDPKADRKAGRLRVMSRRAPRGVRVAPAVKGLAAFLGLR